MAHGQKNHEPSLLALQKQPVPFVLGRLWQVVSHANDLYRRPGAEAKALII